MRKNPDPITLVLRMTIVTKTGDKGETGLYGGQRVSKDDVRMDVIGTVDELNAMIGVVIAGMDTPFPELQHTQNVLFTLGADLATPHENNKAIVPRIEQQHIDELEEWIKILEETPLPPYFVLPGGAKTAAELHVTRAICRRAERCAVSLSQKISIGSIIIPYLNRLSDYLFLAALEVNKSENIENIRVSYS